MKPNQLEEQLRSLLQAGHHITLRWDCGGDESFVHTAIDGQEIESTYEEDDFAYAVEQYVDITLGLPSAGEFSMKGTGSFFLEANEVGLEYKSDAFAYEEDYDDELEGEFTVSELLSMDREPVGERDEEMSNYYSGRILLFEQEK